MAKDKIQIIQINTDPAKKSLKDLRKELKDLKDEMVNLEEGSDAFLEVAQKAGEVKHQIDEISESVKGASSDFGDMVGNITNVAAGLTGAFQAVAGGLQAVGLESKAIDETIKRMQGLMAVTQGLSAIDDGIKSFKKLKVSIETSTTAMKAFKLVSKPAVLAGLAAAVVAIGAAWNKWGDSIRKSLPWLDEWIKKIDGTTERELERLRQREEAYQEYNEKIQQAAADIREKRALDLLTPEAVEQIRTYKDDIILLEAEISTLQGKMNETQDRNLWEQYNQQAIALMENVRQLKSSIEDLYNNPIYRKKDEEETPTTPVVRDGKVEPLGKVTPLVIEPIVAELTEEDKTRIQQVIEQAAETARQKRLEELQGMQDMGDAFFNNLKSSVSVFSESTLGITSGWTAALDDFQQAFTYTMNTIKDTGKMTWENYAQVSAMALGGVATMLNALSNEQDASNEEGFRKMKALQIAATTINVLSGVTAALSGLFTTKSGPWDIALAAIQAATIAATGALQITKIKNTTMTSANPGYNVNAKSVGSMIVPPVQYSQAVQGANTQGAIQSQKVYVTESDITGTIKAVVTQEEENTY